MDIIGTGLEYLLFFILCFGVIAVVFAYIGGAIEFILDFIKSPKGQLKVLFQFILLILGLFFINGVLSLFESSWIGIGNGFTQVWYNIKHTWIIILLVNIFKYVLIVFFWVTFVTLSAFFGYIIGMIPATIINSFLKRILKEDNLSVFPLHPKNFIEVSSLLLTSSFCITPAFWIFIKLFWNFLTNINYTITY